MLRRLPKLHRHLLCWAPACLRLWRRFSFSRASVRIALSYLAHHIVQGKPVVPAAAYLEIALSAARAIAMDHIRDPFCRHPSAVCLRFAAHLAMRSEEQSSRPHFAIYSSAEESQDGWSLHATGEIVSHAGESASNIPAVTSRPSALGAPARLKLQRSTALSMSVV